MPDPPIYDDSHDSYLTASIEPAVDHLLKTGFTILSGLQAALFAKKILFDSVAQMKGRVEP